eukprot:CAMPEP_0204569746 /NCGR_PEP_ID=MMETSP0661-20131031/37925_1 /ASSEMBLY_ACC=CAM_ASM_000606 /TAXON_ID=109239 /ORGANISM="Alexandrium margalefi, Strain AMGDE01CS-322" /LENGTH=238 /DNA_ID=CAMNT_0051577875 /DNA_START=20 /DNA_END=736 /DNA_ORIENTATION=-
MTEPSSGPHHPSSTDGLGDGASIEARSAARAEQRMIFEENGTFPPGRWQFLCQDSQEWVGLGDEESERLKRAYIEMIDQPSTEYRIGDASYESNLQLLRRRDLQSNVRQELRYDGVLPFDLPEPPDASRYDPEDMPFVARQAADHAGWSAAESRARLEEALGEGDTAAAGEELAALVRLINASLTFKQCQELRLGKLAGRAQKELQDAKLKEVAGTIVNKIFKLSQGRPARLLSDPIV